VLGPNGKPLGITVRLGASDGGSTEVVSGLEAGRDLIIGGGPRVADATANTPLGGRRLGF
jgi:HlyD family secretion protein